MSIVAGISGLLFKLWKAIKVMGKLGISLGGLLLLGLYAYQTSLIYPSSLNDGRKVCATPDAFGMPYELVELQTEDGEVLQCFSLKQDALSADYANKTVIMLSPNAGNIGHALPLVSIFFNTFGYNVFIYSYRGYGKSTGTPSEKGLKIDAQCVMKHIESDPQLAQSSKVLYGRSLGGAVAIYIAANFSNDVSGLILENTFLSMRKTVPHVFPFLKPFTVFVHQIWDAESLVPKIPARVPVLMLSARKDEIVPPEHMDALYRLFQSSEKSFHAFEGSSHNDTVMQPGYWELVHEFIRDKVNPGGY